MIQVGFMHQHHRVEQSEMTYGNYIHLLFHSCLIYNSCGLGIHLLVFVFLSMNAKFKLA